ncbi:MAG: hypothetical protein Q9227_008423 [Pyrenula ochraceoflavens]
MAALPPVSTLASLPTLERASVLDILFEPSTQLHTLSVSSLQEHNFPTYENLVDSVASQLETLRLSRLESDHEWLDRILVAHPRLGETKVESKLSRGEQAGLKTNDPDSENELLQLQRLNAEFEEVFNGLKYVVFVNGRGRPEIMEDMKARIEQGRAGERTVDDERSAAIEAMALIAKDRAKKILAVRIKHKADSPQQNNGPLEKMWGSLTPHQSVLLES